MEAKNVIIDKRAEVSAQAQIGAGTTIGPFSKIGPGVVIGSDCEIGAHVEISGPTLIGDSNRISSGALLGQAAAYASRRRQLQGKAAEPALIIGDNNIIREYAVIYGAFAETGMNEVKPTEIGNDNFLMAYIQILAGARLSSNITIANSTIISEGAEIGERAFIAGLALIPPQARVGRLAMIGACAHIQGSVPPFLLADGCPAEVESINVVGIRRADISREAFAEIKKIYKG
ncbi:MAG: acyl-ACP--UDP-N-acetylglucosamine O-acyltransferase, partial [Bacillota bacterium]